MAATIRPALAGDLLAIVDLWDREGGPTRHAGQLHDAQRLIELDSDALFVAESGGAVVASLIVGWDGWRCHVYRLVVEPTARRQGIARQLFQVAADKARRLGAARIDAMVDPGNSAGITFWRSVGFEIDMDRRWSIYL